MHLLETSACFYLITNLKSNFSERSSIDVKWFQFRQTFDVAPGSWLENWSSVQAVVSEAHFMDMVCAIKGGISFQAYSMPQLKHKRWSFDDPSNTLETHILFSIHSAKQNEVERDFGAFLSINSLNNVQKS